MTDTDNAFGWVQVEDKEGPCVDPHGKGAHMTVGGGIINAHHRDVENPRIMCLDCYEELRSGPR